MPLAGAVLVTGLVIGLVAGDAGLQAGHRVWFGVAVPRGDLAELQALPVSAEQRPTVFGIFVKPDSDFTTQTLQRIDDAGMVPFVTLEPWPWRSEVGNPVNPEFALDRVVAGDHDAGFSRIAEAVAGYDGPVYLRFAHEMNGHWYPWAVGQNGNSAADYVAAWRHMHALFERRGAERVTWVWSPNVTEHVRGDVPMSAAWPGEDLVDMVGLTGYGRERTAGDTFADSLAELRAVTDKPILLTETGADGPAKVEWIRSLAPLLARNPDILGFVWFNTSPRTTGATGTYRIDPESTAEVDAFTTMLRDVGAVAE